MGQNWAITIGINRYINLQTLQYAKQDAEAMRDYLRNELQSAQTYHFSDSSQPIQQDFGPALDSKPTFATLRRFFRVRFEEPFLHSGDNLWFFFAGHGVRHEDRDYLMPIDADPGDVSATAIPLHYVTERLQRCGADNVILFLDACRSGVGRRNGLGIGEERQQGVITFFSCSPSESSYEIEELQQGAFTYALLDGLRLQGEGNCATVERLYQHLRYTIPQLNQRYHKPSQHPYGRIEPISKTALILLPRLATLPDVIALKNTAMSAELRQEHSLAKQLWVRVLAISPADADAIEGIERLAQVSSGLPTLKSSSSFLPHTQWSNTDDIASPPNTSIASSLHKQLTLSFEVISVNSQGKVNKRYQKEAECYQEDLGNGLMLDLMVIPSDTYKMGSPESEQGGDDDESPQHRVTIQSFLMGRYAITQAQWRAIALLPKIKHDLPPQPSYFQGDQLPVEGISWQEAIEFCARLSRLVGREYRLPSEAEWEYACRAGTSTAFYYGATVTPDLANYNSTSTYLDGSKGEYRKKTMPVGTFSPNSFGLYDMHGNVWKWCLDCWHTNYQGAPQDGSPWITGGDEIYRTLRGGSWYFPPWNCRAASRLKGWLEGRDGDVGFRVASFL